MLLHKLHLIQPEKATRRTLRLNDALTDLHRTGELSPRRRRASHYVARFITAAAIASAASQGAILIELAPESALYNSDLRGIVDDGGTAGSKSGVPVLGAAEHAGGATFNITFTPSPADLERVAPTTARTVLLVEFGGTSNGIGLYLIDGVPTVLSKQSSNDVTVPASLNDTTLPAIAVQSPIGKLNAGSTYSFSASWDHAGTLELKVRPEGGSAITSRHAISGTPGNWSGNDTLSVRTISNTGSAGGLAGNDAVNQLGAPFDVHNAFNFAGEVTQALFWNASAVTPPVPSAPEVLGFEVTALPSTGQLRLHWRVTEGGAPATTTIEIKAGATTIHSPTTLEGFFAVPADSGTVFTLSATNASGTTETIRSIAAENAFTAAVRADQPEAWYRFNEPGGSLLIADSAENATPHTGRTFGQAVSGSTGFVDGAALFDGGSGVILTPAVLDPGTLDTGFTVEAIVRRAPGVVGGNPVILGQRGSGGRVHLASAADGKILTDLGGGQIKTADGKLNDDAWAHLAIVVDVLHTEIRWYVDGVQAGSSADGLNSDGTTFDPNFLLEAATDDWIIGVGKALAGNHWKGHIDEIAVYRGVLDDPNGDTDKGDSRIAAHRDAWWTSTAGLLDFSASETTVNAGDAVDLLARVGPDISSVNIDNGVGNVPIVNGRAAITIHPTASATYQVTATGPGGSSTRSIAITALQYQAPIVKGFQVTKLGNAGQVRLHWKVSEGEASNPTSLVIKAGATELHTTTTLQGFVDVEAGSATSFTLVSTNSTGTTEATDDLDAENDFSIAVRQDAPIAWFRFNDPAGAELFVDSADNAAPHNGSKSGSPVSGAEGVVDGAIILNANGAIVSDRILNPGQLDPGFTIESVVRKDVAINTVNRAIVSQSDLNGTGRVLLGLSDDKGIPRTYLGGTHKDADKGLAAEVWAHLVVVVDALHTEVRWYLDGELIGTTKDGLNPDGSTFDPNFIFEASDGVWNIGAQKTLTNDRWRGEIDEVVIYNTLLDDPDADPETADSRIPAHRAAWWNQTSGVIQLSSEAITVPQGESTNLTIKVGPDITSVSIDHGIGNVPLVNGNAVVPLNPGSTTTYTVSVLPPDFSSRFLYSNTNSPLVGPPARFAGANPLPSPDPAWSLLHTHYRSYSKLSGGNSPHLDAAVTSITARPTAATAGGQLLRHKAFTEQQLAPVIAKAQFVFSLAFGYQPDTLPGMWSDGSARKTPPQLRDEYITWLVIDPVITLWNPYNVPMRFTGARVDLYRIPLAYRIYKNGQLINAEYTKLTNAHTPEDFKTREARFYRLNILPESGANERLLAPGEHVVFTAHNHRMHGSHGYNINGVDMRPGFHPPAGNASDEAVGGVTTQNIFVNSNGGSSGKDYGKTVRTIAVKAGDRIQIEVKPERAGIDDFKETGGKEITGFMKYYLGGGNVTRLLGGIELDYGDREKDLLPHFPPDELPTIVVSPDIPKGGTAGLNPARHALRFKEPFLIATFQEKTERDSRFPSRSWIGNAPVNQYSSAGLDQAEGFDHHQYEFKWEAMTDWPPNSPTIEISNTDNRGYGGPGIYAQSGVELATFASLPLAPAHSLAQLRHAPLNAGGQLPLTAQAVANSFEPPLLGTGKVRAEAGNRVYLDHSYLANNALFDRWYLSSAADHPALPGQPERKAKALLKDFFSEGKALPNRRFIPHSGGKDAIELAERLESSSESYREISAHLLIDAPFNVNSTRVAAWQAFLASNFGAAAPLLEDGSLELHEGDGLPVLRHSHVVASDFESGSGPRGTDHAKWNGYRRLSGTQIERLAEEIVAEVKKRGPFQSVAEFVNRRPGDAELGKKGALETAVERAGINAALLDPAYALADGANTADGAPGVINQADLLTPLAPQLVARGDTFRVRVYGESEDRGTKVWAEAVVQREPQFIDSTDKPEAADPESPVNKRFGRRFEIVSFRWMKEMEL